MVKSNDSDHDSEDLLVRALVGDLIIEEGQVGSEMYLIADGEVEVFRRLGDGERQVALLTRGDFFGEMAVLEQGAPHAASVRARTECRLLPVGSAEFDFFLHEHPDVTLRILRHLAHRVRAQEEETQRVHEVAAGAFAAVPRERLRDMSPIAVDSVGPAARLVHEPTTSAFDLASERTVVVGRFDPVTRNSTDIDLDNLDRDRSLSRRHAKIRSHEGHWYLSEEVAVRNGTFVGRRKLQPEEEVELRDGDLLRFGLVELRFRLLTQPQSELT